MNRGKESIALDLKAAERPRDARPPARRADVLVENFRPGTMERLGLGWAALHARFPRLIYAAASGFGHSGPYSARPAYDMVAQAMGGIMSITGQPGGPPTRVGSSIGDLAAGLFTRDRRQRARSLHRERTGEAIEDRRGDARLPGRDPGKRHHPLLSQAACSPGPLGARHPSIAPFAAFATADGHIIVAGRNRGAVRQARRDARPSGVAERSALCPTTRGARRTWRSCSRRSRRAERRSSAEWLGDPRRRRHPIRPHQRCGRAVRRSRRCWPAT